jgi:uncharacterized protein YkwD
MRRGSIAGLAVLLASTACVIPDRQGNPAAVYIPGAQIPPPTGTKNAYDAVAYTVAAAEVTAIDESEKAAARNAPLRPTACGASYRDTCNTGRALEDPSPPDDRDEMTVAEARRHTLVYINGIRSLQHLPLLELDDALTEFAQEGSEQVAKDHRAHGHFHDKGAECPGCGENQSGEAGWRVEPVGKQIDEILALMMAEGPGGGHHDNLLSPRWRHLGVGITNPGGEMYLTTDFAP